MLKTKNIGCIRAFNCGKLPLAMPHDTQLEMGALFGVFDTLDWLQWQPIVAMPLAALSASQQATIRIGQQATQRGEGGGRTK